MKKKIFAPLLNFVAAGFFTAFLASCSKTVEMDIAEIEELQRSVDYGLVSKTVSKPYKNQPFVDGTVGGVWYDSILSEPKTFNQLVAQMDGSSVAIIYKTVDYLVAYDTIEKKWIPQIADFEIETNETEDTLTVHYTIKEDAFWTYYNSDKKIPVTSDDFVFWYNEIEGDEEAGLGGYDSQCITMADGTEKHIDCIKITDKKFDFVFPRIVANPCLATNMPCCPSFLFRPAKEKDGINGIKNLFSVNCDVKTIPSCGSFYITEYIPARRLVFTRNERYWQKDGNGNSFPYYDQLFCQIIGDQNTDYLLFTQGKLESYVPRPEELSDVVNNQNDDYTVFNAEGSMHSMLWAFNQNPVNKEQPYCRWFSKKEFRQAMSCILNRERIIRQTYRGLAQPRYYFFPPANPFYNEKIQLEYKYNLERAEKLLKSVGFRRGEDGLMYDEDGIRVEFDISCSSGITTTNDMALIIADEAAKIGIKVNVRQVDFQKMIESISYTYDWQSCFIAFGSMLFPTQGSNVWKSNGNMHLWNPLQKTPATEWEARIDYLYEEGSYTIDYNAAKKIWDEYQSILLEQCPIIYMVRPRSFFAIRNRWDLSNVYYDNLNGAEAERVFLKSF